MLMDDITNTFKELISLIDPDLSGGCLPIKIKKHTHHNYKSHYKCDFKKSKIKNRVNIRNRTLIISYFLYIY